MEESTRKPGKRVRKGSVPTGLIAGVAALAVAGAAVCGYFGLCSWVKGNGCLLPGSVAVDDQGETVADLGKLSQEDALAAVTQEMDQRLESRTLTLLYGDGRQAELTGELMAISPDAAVEVGMAAKEDQPLWKLGALWLGLIQEPTDLSLSAAALTPEGEAQARRVIKAIADELYVPPVDFTYEIGDQAVEVTPGTDGQTLDTNALFEAVKNALIHGETELRVETDAVPGAELSGQVLSSLVHLDPQPAGLDANGRLTPAVIGRSVNAEEAQTILDGAAPGESCSIPLEFTPPEGGVDENLYYKDLLSTVTTTVSGTSDRFHNVALSASFCQGKVLQPGEVFSYLSMVSPISTAHGFQVGTGYQNGQTVDMVGGGVCQMSSSLYYCAVYANLEIVSRANHAFATGYIPNGLDATVYAPSLDFKFRNNTGFPLKIVTSMSGKQLTVQLYGTNIDGTKVETERYTRSTTEWTTVYKPDASIARGSTKVSVTPYTGYVVDVYRCVYDSSGKLLSRTFENHSSYAKRDKVILYNP
ncbi:MAG: VanW family protein, partial [Oscillospiraceae bacterium]|nr:VanW family protein [Oscillospiraceae bacterium]